MGGPDKSGLSFGTTYCLSAAAACIAESSTFPFDITKTRMMLASNEAGAPKGMVSTAKGIVREEVGGPERPWRSRRSRVLSVYCRLPNIVVCPR